MMVDILYAEIRFSGDVSFQILVFFLFRHLWELFVEVHISHDFMIGFMIEV